MYMEKFSCFSKLTCCGLTLELSYTLVLRFGNTMKNITTIIACHALTDKSLYSDKASPVLLYTSHAVLLMFFWQFQKSDVSINCVQDNKHKFHDVKNDVTIYPASRVYKGIITREVKQFSKHLSNDFECSCIT